MLYPQNNRFRQLHDLSGYWHFRADIDAAAAREDWTQGFENGRVLPVPASWNELLTDLYEFFGDGWYMTTFDLPWGWRDQHIELRFESVNYLADVWLNGAYLGQHEGGHLPFAFAVDDHINPTNNVLVVRVNGESLPTHVPPGNVPPDPLDAFADHSSQYPATSYDFFPFCGIQRPVFLVATPHTRLEDITVRTDIHQGAGIVALDVSYTGDDLAVRVTIDDQQSVSADGSAQLTIPDARLWSPAAPNLYDLHVELLQDDTPIDAYTLRIGIRTVQVQGDQLLLNGEPIYMRGFGRHEDAPLAGRGYTPLTVVKDYELMRWIGANSFRTSHYPYAQPALDLADELGFLVISETPAVGLFFQPDGLQERTALWHTQIRELITRDKNHPSVIMWSLANEPNTARPEAAQPFADAYALARNLDDTRPLTHTNYLGARDHALQFADVISLNRYNGWYVQAGRIDEGIAVLSAELDALHEHFQAPFIITEFGVDTLAGMHHEPPVMFSEEYQVAFLTAYIRLFATKPYVVGEHIWNLCDFRTGQGVRRVGALNLKGVFTRDRQPKSAAFALRQLWSGTVQA